MKKAKKKLMPYTMKDLMVNPIGAATIFDDRVFLRKKGGRGKFAGAFIPQVTKNTKEKKIPADG